jgi:ATP-binding cassette subfamily B protein
MRRLPETMATGLRLVWRAAPREMALNAALQLVVALAVTAQVLAGKRLLDRLLTVGDGESFRVVVGPLVLLSVASAVAAISTVVRTEQQRVLAELVSRSAITRVHEVSAAVDLLAFDSPAFHDRLERARVNALSRPLQMGNGVLGVLSALFTLAGISLALLLIEPLFFVLILVAYVPVWLATTRASRVAYRFSVAQVERDRRRLYLSLVLSRRDEAAEVRAFSLSGFLRRRHDALYQERIDDVRVLATSRMRMGMVAAAVTVVLNGGAIALLVWLVSNGTIGVADAGAVAGAMVLLSGRLDALAGSAGSVYESSLFIEDFTSFVAELPELERRAGAGAAVPPLQSLVADHVSFSYPSRAEPVLRDVSVRVEQGQVVALVGENGSGKTTLAKLLAGLYDPSVGTVQWNGVPLVDLDRSAVRDNVGIIFQDFVRYTLSAYDNIAVGRHERDDPAALREAAERASADGFLTALDDGYDTLLGTEYSYGTELSIGQWQRVALARAFFRDAPLLILDEPTAALDPRTEAEFFDRIRQLYRDRTVLLISHRFSTVRNADHIYVLEHGQVAEHGTHDELMHRQGKYAELFSLQAAGFIEPGPDSSS